MINENLFGSEQLQVLYKNIEKRLDTQLTLCYINYG